jgi:hypothetical protein
MSAHLEGHERPTRSVVKQLSLCTDGQIDDCRGVRLGAIFVAVVVSAAPALARIWLGRDFVVLAKVHFTVDDALHLDDRDISDLLGDPFRFHLPGVLGFEVKSAAVDPFTVAKCPNEMLGPLVADEDLPSIGS